MLFPNLITEMQRRHITVKQLAKSLGLSSHTVRCKLRGKREFDLAEVERLAALFGCSLDYLVGHEVKTAGLENCGGRSCRATESRSA